jgi:hypothetical protein
MFAASVVLVWFTNSVFVLIWSAVDPNISLVSWDGKDDMFPLTHSDSAPFLGDVNDFPNLEEDNSAESEIMTGFILFVAFGTPFSPRTAIR